MPRGTGLHSGTRLILLPPRSRRTKFRKQANAADNRAATMSVDSLINYDAVKVRFSQAPKLSQRSADTRTLRPVHCSTSTTKRSRSRSTTAR